jgi:hypothetical protein
MEVGIEINLEFHFTLLDISLKATTKKTKMSIKTNSTHYKKLSFVTKKIHL